MLKESIKHILNNAGYEVQRHKTIKDKIPEISNNDIEIFEKVSPYTMTSAERKWALVNAIKYLNRNGLAGDVVECGVFKGGSIFLAMLADERHGAGIERRFHLFDTFAGMTEPTDVDRDHMGNPTMPIYEQKDRGDHNDWVYAPLVEVKANARACGCDLSKMNFVKGDVTETLRDEHNLPEKIALLRLDTDWYESTKCELEVLFPRLVAGGFLIIDDYGHFEGARKAVDEYFGPETFFHRIDYTAVMIQKFV